VDPPGKRRINWASVPFVTVDLPTCPHCCVSIKYDRVRTESNGVDGSVTKLVICRGCAKPFKIVLTIPVSGDWIYPAPYDWS
jgi:hypothetical protein